MKKLLILLTLASVPLALQAHDHVEIGLDPANASKLKPITLPPAQMATFFPAGEVPSFNTPVFPGNAYATVLTFSAFDNTAPPPAGAMVRIDLVAVSGPSGGKFAFWEVDATTPTWQLASGWSAAPGDAPSFFASEDGTGYGHIHGRVFSTTAPGVYDVTFRAVDASGRYVSSDPFVVRFTAINPPQLRIGTQGTSLRLTFQTRADLVYDLQSSTTLQPGSWSTLSTLDGTGADVEYLDPLNARSRVFYRIVEYR